MDFEKAFESGCPCYIPWQSDFFNLERGICQGDPLSPYLFIIAVEILATAIRTNTDIHGIKIGDNEIKLLQYEDDTTGILRDEASLESLLQVLRGPAPKKRPMIFG